jgi:non-ribosomal peptide synthetase component F
MPTEATVGVSYFYCEEYREYLTYPIGKPATNTELYILNKNNK